MAPLRAKGAKKNNLAIFASWRENFFCFIAYSQEEATMGILIPKTSILSKIVCS
jgi:hypothetical protein